MLHLGLEYGEVTALGIQDAEVFPEAIVQTCREGRAGREPRELLRGGVVMAGDRRSTQGNMIAGRDVQKVYITDDYTVTGIAGTAAIAVEFARLYAVELEHYEKLEGVALTFAGKVNRLATMVRGNLGAALQGFVALPLLAGYDLDDPNPESAGRIVSFDAAGGHNLEEEGYQSVGSGSIFAKSSMKKLYSQVRDADSALRVAIESLYDAADDDSATGGPDLTRGIYPTAVLIGAEGAAQLLARLHGETLPTASVDVGFTLQVGESVFMGIEWIQLVYNVSDAPGPNHPIRGPGRAPSG